MNKKSYPTTSLQNELSGASLYFQKKPSPPPDKATRTREDSRDKARGQSRRPSQAAPSWPSRNEIQEFSFQLRDEMKVKVQAEVPPAWQKELDNLAHALGIRKLELYRFILGEFLGKVKRKQKH